MSLFKTGDRGELSYVLLILEKVPWPGLGLSFQGESILGQKTVQQRKKERRRKEQHGLWRLVDVMGSTALSLVSGDLS